MSITKKQSDALNVIRWSSTVAIVTCHFLQGYGSAWAWVLNIGVQIFFFLSGFLYGGKTVPSIPRFYWGRFKKVYLPYAAWLLVAFALLWCLADEKPSVMAMGKMFLVRGTVPGLNHLWFMFVIIVCYLILPFFDRLVSKNAMLGISIFAVASGLLLTLKYNSLFLWITLYFIGYLCGRYGSIQRYVLAVAACVSAWLLIDSGFDLEFWSIGSWQNNVLHAAGGIVIFMTLYFCFGRIQLPDRISKLFATGGSYEVYLTHQLFILGSLSLLWLTPSRLLNCIIILAIIFVCTVGLMRVSALTRRLP